MQVDEAHGPCKLAVAAEAGEGDAGESTHGERRTSPGAVCLIAVLAIVVWRSQCRSRFRPGDTSVARGLGGGADPGARAGRSARSSPIHRTPRDRCGAQLASRARRARVRGGSLGLRVGRSFTMYTQLTHDTLVLVLSGAYQDRLRAGDLVVPDRGRRAVQGVLRFRGGSACEGRAATARGSTRICARRRRSAPSAGSTTPSSRPRSREDSLDLANTVIHELTHNTITRPVRRCSTSRSQISWGRGGRSSSSARGATRRGSRRRRRGGQTRRRWARSGRGSTISSTRLFGPILPTTARGARCDSRLVTRSSARRGTPSRRTSRSVCARFRPTRWPARVSTTRRYSRGAMYLTDLDQFDAVYAANGGNLRAAVRQIIAIAHANKRDPFGGLEAAAMRPRK